MGSRTYRIDSKRNKQDKSKIIRKSDIESISELRSITKVVKPCWGGSVSYKKYGVIKEDGIIRGKDKILKR